MEKRREPVERRKLVDLTRTERGEPERRSFPGLERRDLEERVPAPPPLADDRPEDAPGTGSSGA